MQKDDKDFATRAIRLQSTRSSYSEHSVPLYLTSSYAFESAEEAEGKFAGTIDGPIYSRYNNPNSDELALKMASLEGAESAVSCSSGMAAIFSALSGTLSQGDHIVCAKAVFGSTYTLLSQVLPRFGIDTTFVDLVDLSAWERAIGPRTRAFFIESPSNPGLMLGDIAALSALARSRNLLVFVDNSFASPWIQNPIAHGAHIVCHSTTKFLDGQGRTLGGVVCGPSDLIENIFTFMKATGPTMSPFNAWVVSKSLETLEVRMERHSRNAMEIALFLSEQKFVQEVRYPFLPSHPQYDLARRQMRTGGAMVSFDLGTRQRAMDFINHLDMISVSANLGDTRSIITHPCTTTHAKVPVPLREECRVTEGLVRMSVGLESVDDLKQDLAEALAALT